MLKNSKDLSWKIVTTFVCNEQNFFFWFKFLRVHWRISLPVNEFSTCKRIEYEATFFPTFWEENHSDVELFPPCCWAHLGDVLLSPELFLVVLAVFNIIHFLVKEKPPAWNSMSLSKCFCLTSTLWIYNASERCSFLVLIQEKPNKTGSDQSRWTNWWCESSLFRSLTLWTQLLSCAGEVFLVEWSADDYLIYDLCPKRCYIPHW